MKKTFTILSVIIFISTASSQYPSWLVRMGGNSQCVSSAITYDANGCTYTTGHFGGTNYFDPDYSGLNITCPLSYTNTFITKHDSVGQLVWVKTFGPNFINSDDITIDNGGNVYIVGTYQNIIDFDPDSGTYNLGPSYANNEAFVVKLDMYGKFKWAYNYSGMTGENTAEAIAIKNNKILITGSFQDSVDFDAGPGIYKLGSNGESDIFILELDTSGSFIRAINLGGSGGDCGTDIKIDNENNILINGIFSDGIDADPGLGIHPINTQIAPLEYFIFKYDTAFNLIWANSIHGSQDNSRYDLAIDNNNNIYLGAAFNDSLFWGLGATSLNLSAPFGVQHMYILKMDKNGDFKWAKQIKGNEHPTLNAIDVNNGLIVFTGALFGRYDFNPGIDSFFIESNDPYNPFLGILDTAGNFVGAIQIEGGGYSHWGTDISLDPFLGLYLTGIYADSMDIDPSPLTQYLHVVNTPIISNCVILKYNLNSIGIENETMPIECIAYPNPFTTEIRIKTFIELKNASIAISDASGRLIRLIEKINGTNHIIDLKELNNGFYFIRVTSQNRSTTIKVIKN